MEGGGEPDKVIKEEEVGEEQLSSNASSPGTPISMAKRKVKRSTSKNLINDHKGKEVNFFLSNINNNTAEALCEKDSCPQEGGDGTEQKFDRYNEPFTRALKNCLF
jgi:hypothetical protein